MFAESSRACFDQSPKGLFIGARNMKVRIQGHCRGTIDGLPAIEGRYQSARQGSSSFFRASSWPVDHEFEHDGGRYRVVENIYRRGDAWFVSTYYFEAVRVDE